MSYAKNVARERGHGHHTGIRRRLRWRVPSFFRRVRIGLRNKIVASCLVAIIVFTFGMAPLGVPIGVSHRADAAPALAPADKLLTPDEAFQRMLKSNADYRTAKDDVTVKEIELRQAYSAVKNQELKDLIPILIGKPRSLGQDIELHTKISEATRKLDESQKAVEVKERELRYETDRLYLGAVKTLFALRAAQSRYEAELKKTEDVRRMKKYSLVSEADAEKAEESLKQAESQLKTAKLTHKSSTLQLGEAIGLDLESGYTFAYEPDYALLPQERLWPLIDAASQKDFDLYKAVQNRKMAEERIAVTRNLYVGKFGAADTRIIESMYGNGDINYDVYMANYEVMLDLVKKQWEGLFFIPIPFIPIILPIPKIVLQGEYDGLRYFDDKKYALPVFMHELDAAKLKENDARKKLIAKIKQSYLDLKQSEEAYAQALIGRDKSEKKFDQEKLKVISGLMAKEELTPWQDALSSANDQVFAAQLSYRLAVGKLDFDTGGAVMPELRKGILPYQTIDDGLGAMNKPPAEKPLVSGSWKIDPAIPGLLKQLEIKPDAAIGATHYRLFDAKSGKPIGSLLELKNKTKHLNLAFNDLSGLFVRLYKGGTAVADATLVGSGSTGVLNVGAMAGEQGAAGGKADNGKVNDAGKAGGGKASDEVKAGSDKPPAEKAGAAGFAPGTLVIGNFVIHKDALTPENYNAAKASIPTSGQGTYYKSEFTDGAWFNLDMAFTLKEIVDPKGRAAVGNGAIDKLKLTAWIDAAGAIHKLATNAELDEQLGKLKKEKEQLEKDSEKLVESGKMSESANTAIQMKNIDALVAFLQALRDGDMPKAAEQLGKINNTAALLADMQQEAASMLAEDQKKAEAALAEAKAAGDEKAVAEQEAKLAELAASASDVAAAAAEAEASAGGSEQAAQERLGDAQAELAQALQAAAASAGSGGSSGGGDAGGTLPAAAKAQVAAAAQAMLAAKAAAAPGAPELAASVAALTQAQRQLAAAASEAQAEGSSGRAAELATALAALDASLAQASKELLLLQLAAVAEPLAPPAVGKETPAAVAAQLAQAMAEAQAAAKQDILAQLKELEASKYTLEELKQLTSIGDKAEQASDGKLEALPVTNVIATQPGVKFTFPPVLANGNAYIHIRPISQSFGALVDWNDKDRTVTISKNGVIVVCQVGSQTAMFNGKPVKLEAAPVYIDGRVIVPLHFVAQALGLQVQWDAASQMILIQE